VTAGAGVDASKLATAKRPDDGTEQATYGGWPLYTFAKDTKPGDVNGQDSGGIWYVIGADGNPIED
jgi:predicted lipoprotein with Yx(FWY)xxD motif